MKKAQRASVSGDDGGYRGVQPVRTGARAGCFRVAFNCQGKRVHAGTWPTARAAAIARDRCVLAIWPEGPLNLPAVSRKLGPASAEELERLARLEHRRATGRSEAEGVVRVRTSWRAGSFKVAVPVGGVVRSAGCWLTEREAVLARDRLWLFAKAPQAHLASAEARRLGPASPEELRRLARARYKEQSGATSTYWGVGWDPVRERWIARVLVGDQSRIVGQFLAEDDAAMARDRVEKFLRGKDARLNFPARAVWAGSLADVRKDARALRKLRTTSRYSGVYYARPGAVAPWVATLTFHVDGRRKTLFLGIWESDREAARAHDRAVLHYLGGPTDRVHLNLPAERKLEPADAPTLVSEARRAYKARTSSRFRGVSWLARGQRWSALFKYRGFRAARRFDDERDAARWYDQIATAKLGELALLNFHPETGEELCGKRLSDPLVVHREGQAKRKARRRSRRG